MAATAAMKTAGSTLGEEANLDVRITPALAPDLVLPGVSFKIEIVREVAGGEQHIDWVDVDETDNYTCWRPLNFSKKQFRWNGIPSMGFGASAPQAIGCDSFQGLSTSAIRILPTVTVLQPVPPPFVTAVATIVRNSDQTKICESRKRVCVQQVVKIGFTADAISRIKAGLFGSTNGVPVSYIQNISDDEWEMMRTSIPVGAQNLIDYTDANIRIVNDSTVVSEPHKTISVINGNSGVFGYINTTDFSFMNTKMSGHAFIDIGTLYNNFPIYTDVTNGTFALPITPNELRLHCINVAVHESCHLFGLVADNDVLGGVNTHNANPVGTYIMDDGESVPLAVRFGRTGFWGWRQLNKAYLKFVFPKE